MRNMSFLCNCTKMLRLAFVERDRTFEFYLTIMVKFAYRCDGCHKLRRNVMY